MVSRLLLRFFLISSLSLSFLFIPPSNCKPTTCRMRRRISRRPSICIVHAAFYHFRGKDRRGSLYSLRIGQLRTRCAEREEKQGGKNMEQARGKMVKRIDESFWGQKGRLCFAADCSFFLLPPEQFSFFSVQERGLECFTPRPQPLRILTTTYRSDFPRATNNNVTSVLLLNQNVFSLPFAIFVSQESRRRFSNSPHFIEIREAVNFNIGKKIIEIGI